ncbi:MAG: PKD domain-containing protein [Candidatus Zixiibacteriota bacterium]
MTVSPTEPRSGVCEIIRKTLLGTLVSGAFILPGHLAADSIGHEAQVDGQLQEALKTALRAPAITELNVEVDYMVAPGHSHILNPLEIAALQAMFACQGIVLNIEISDSIPEILVLEFGASGIFDNNGANGFLNLKNQHFDHLGQPGWHYCIMGHMYESGPGQTTTSSGLAEILGDDFIVTLGAFGGGVGSAFNRTGTFAHEFGHNLGLTHAGNQDEGIVTQYKPNYPSVMTYRYQLSGVRQELVCQRTSDSCLPFRHLDFSHGTMPTLDENALVEISGVGLGPVDWNCNGQIDTFPVVADLAKYPCGAGGGGGNSLEIDTDYDDWSNIVDVTFSLNRNALERRQTVSCITFEEATAQRSHAREAMIDCLDDAPANAEACVYPFEDSDADGLGDICDNCAEIYNPLQIDMNEDEIGDVCLHAVVGSDTTVGMIPLTIQFNGSSDLAVSAWDWTFGDGAVSNLQSPVHEYTNVGFYDVTLGVVAGAEGFTAFKNKYIKALADTLIGRDAHGPAGSQVRFDFYAVNTQKLRQVLIPFSWAGPLNLTLLGASVEGLRSENVSEPKLISIDPFNKRAVYTLTATADTTTLLAPDTGVVLSLFFDIPPGAVGANTIELINWSSFSPTFTSDEVIYNPISRDGQILPGCCQVAGDANNDGSVNIADVTFLIARIFASGAAPPCCDQASATGDGSVNIGDVTFLIALIFAGGAPPLCGPAGMGC